MTRHCTMISGGYGSHPESAERGITNLPSGRLNHRFTMSTVYYNLLYAAHIYTDMGVASFQRECTVQINQNYVQPTSKPHNQLC